VVEDEVRGGGVCGFGLQMSLAVGGGIVHGFSVRTASAQADIERVTRFAGFVNG
jgi:hypothetical protein